MFRKYVKTATVKRLAYTGTTYKKSGFVAVSGTYMGHLKALTTADGITLEMFGKQFEFTTNILANILQGDRLTIDSIDYEVNAAQDYRGISFNCKKVLLTKAV